MTEGLYLSDHARRRSSQRGIPPARIEWAYANGRSIRTSDATIIFFGRKEAQVTQQRYAPIGAGLAGAEVWGTYLNLEKCTNLCLVVADDGTVVTAYRSRRAPRSGRR